MPPAVANSYWRKSGLRAHLRQLRTEFSMTNEDLEREVGYNANSISSWLSGYSVPPLAVVVDLAQAFDHRLCLVDFRERTHKRRLKCPDPDAHREDEPELPL